MPERELKLEAPPHFDPPDLNGIGDGVVAADPVEQRLRTVYWDTPDVRLARWGCSLRHRSGEGWTAKLAPAMEGEVMVREEHEFTGSRLRPPGAALDLLRAFVRGGELKPVASLKTRRRAVSLRDDAGQEKAEVVDDEVSVLDGRRIAVRFRQIEVELKSPHANGLVQDVAARLRSAGAGAPDPVPKYVRALGPRSQQPPEVVPLALDPTSSGASVIQHAIAESVVRLLRNDALVRLGGNPESVHQARVATRRLRSDLRTFAPLMDPEWVSSLREELKWLGDMLGEVRDADILTQRVQARLRGISDGRSRGRPLVRRLAGRRRSARRRLLVAMRSQRYIDLLERLVTAAQAPLFAAEADPAAAEVLLPMVRRTWERLVKAVKKLDKPPADRQLHAVRIAAKRARYASEAVAPVVGKQAQRFAETVAELQQTLGDYNDSVVTVGWLFDTASGMAASTAFIAGALTERERAEGTEIRDAWPSVWKRLSRRKLHGWMDA